MVKRCERSGTTTMKRSKTAGAENSKYHVALQAGQMSAALEWAAPYAEELGKQTVVMEFVLGLGVWVQRCLGQCSDLFGVRC